MIVLNQVNFAYPHKDLLFEGFDWQVERGQSWAVLGPSGCGKTTLLYLLAGLLFPSAGQVIVDGQVLARPRPQTGLILQDFGLLPWSNVIDNVRLGLRIRRFYGPDGKHSPAQMDEWNARDEAARAWVKRLGLSGLENQYPGQLSGGQRQRVAIARTLALQPDLLLMDEPFSSLDAPTRMSLRDLTLSLRAEQQFTFVVITHAIEEAAHLGQYILMLGRPPHRKPQIIPNPCFGRPNFADTDDYRALTRLVGEQLQTLTAGETAL